MSTPVALRPNSELVACAWLGGVAGLAPAMVATQLPTDVSAWAATGFLTVAVIGGTPGLDSPIRRPQLRLDAWAVAKGKPQWFMANALLERVDAGCRAAAAGRWVTLPGSYPAAHVLSVWLTTEPQRVYDDAGDLARYTATLSLIWTTP